MAREYLGDGFDVHGGGLDLVFPHHENERAQSEAAGARPFTRRWLHNGMLRLSDEKMSKSTGNVERLRDALDRLGRETLLTFFAGAHYRMPIDYNERALDQAAAVAARFRETLRNARRYVRAGASGADDGVAIVGRDAAAAFDAAMADDLGTPAALAVLHGLAGELNAAVSGGDADPAAVAAAADSLRDALWVLGLDTLDPGARCGRRPCRARRARGRSASARARAGTSPRRTGSGTRSRGTATWCATRHRDPSWCRAMPRPEREPRRRNEEPRDDVVYGVQPVREALRGQRRVREVVCTERTAEQPWLVEAAAAGARVDVVPVEVVTSLAGRPDHQGVAALCDHYPYADAFELLSGAHPLVVVLDGVTDPRNLGAIVRACDGAGADGLVLPRHGSAGVTSIVAKASAGAVEHVRIAMATNLAELLRRTKRPDLWSYAAEAEGGAAPWEIDFTSGTLLVLGSEGSGIRPLVRRLCDAAVTIPQAGQIASLNVAVAAGTLLYEAARQRAVASG